MLTTLQELQARVAEALDNILPRDSSPSARLHEAMRYATLAGGKRIRACLVYAAGEAIGAPRSALDAPACAVELIHAYSLIHDDLPCMDDDAMRRGKPACHKAYGEATALLAGDALQALAFEVLADIAPPQGTRMLQTLARAIGSHGMAGGQALDLEGNDKRDLSQLEDGYARKTGALIQASVLMGAAAGPQDNVDAQAALRSYGAHIGLAFQIIDDILDIADDTQLASKPTAGEKITYPLLVGTAAAKTRAHELHDHALASIVPLGDNTQLLVALAHYLLKRVQ